MLNFVAKFNKNEDITIDFVGDSVTNGLDHCCLEETYVAKFAALIARKFENYCVYRYDGVIDDALAPMKNFDGPILVSYKEKAGKIDIVKNGIGGNTIQRALNRIDDFTGVLANGKRPDVTFLMFGINDALKSDPEKYVTAEQFKSNYKMLISEVRKRNPDTFIIMLSATYNDQTIDEHCEKSKDLAREEDIPYIDLHELWLRHYNVKADNFGQGDWLANNRDACHPTPKAAHIMAEKICNGFLEIIGDV